jgi:hypothetical protein
MRLPSSERQFAAFGPVDWEAMSPGQRWGWATLAGAVLAVMAGCGTPGAPLAPSLNLPQPVTDLSAIRAGDQVSLSWTMPKRNTDKLPIKGDMTVRICRQEGAGPCVDAGTVTMAPGAAGSFAETLPTLLASGPPREMKYFVELKNRKAKSAGLSNAGVTLAGAPPEAVRGFAAEVQKAGVVLRWTPDDEKAGVRLQRKLLTPPATKPAQGLMTPQPEPLEQNLLIEEVHDGRALDKSIHFGETYEYRAQRVARVTVGGTALELAGELSPAVDVEAKDVFPPAVPAGLAAVATVGEKAGESAIDLSWSPDSEADLTGYVMYRREGDAAWERISPAEPVGGPAFHDAHVQPGHTYHYAVSAVDQDGHESARSAETQETVPNP